MNTKNNKVKNIDWKFKMRLAVIAGERVKCLNGEQEDYLKMLQDKKKRYEEKIKALMQKDQDRIDQIRVNAEAQVQRIADAAIKREQQKIDMQAAEDRAKEKAAPKIKAKIEAKKKRRIDNILNKTIPTPGILKEHKRQQEFLATVRAEKRKDVKKRIADIKKEITDNKAAAEEKEKKRIEFLANKIKNLRKGNKGPKVRTTKAQRIENIIQVKKRRYEEYLRELQLRKSEAEAKKDNKEFLDKQAKRKELEAKKLLELAERRKARRDKKIAVALAQKKKMQKDLERFRDSEKIRLAKKEAKRAKYRTKGGIEVPKVKNKVEIRWGDTSNLPKVHVSTLKQYAVIIGNLTDKNNIIDTLPQIIKCKPETLNNHVKGFHNEMMKLHQDIYVGTFVYNVDDLSHCIFEMINSNRLSIDGKLVSRLAAQREETIEKLKKKAA